MKRLIVLFIILFSLLCANPIDPRAYISEIQIMTPKNWIMEIGDEYSMFSYWDSVCIEGRFGSEKLININRDDSTGYILITPDDLSDSLEFDRNNDRIQVTFFSSEDQDYTYYVKIGDYPGSYLHNIDATQSLAVSGKYPPFFKDDTPTLGSINTYEGGLGKIYGYFYCSNDNPINNKSLYLETAAFTGHVDTNGYYEYKMPSRYYYADSIRIYPIEGQWQYINIQNLVFDLEPGDSIEMDIHQLISSITPVIQNTIKFNNYPHPASSYTRFFIDNTDVEASAMRVNIYALNGRKVDSFIPSAKQFRYDCAHLPQGSYVMSLQKGSDVLATKKLQILK